MFWEQIIRDEKEDARAEGLAEGRAEGRAEGKLEGKAEAVLSASAPAAVSLLCMASLFLLSIVPSKDEKNVFKSHLE